MRVCVHASACVCVCVCVCVHVCVVCVLIFHLSLVEILGCLTWVKLQQLQPVFGTVIVNVCVYIH